MGKLSVEEIRELEKRLKGEKYLAKINELEKKLKAEKSPEKVKELEKLILKEKQLAKEEAEAQLRKEGLMGNNLRSKGDEGCG